MFRFLSVVNSQNDSGNIIDTLRDTLEQCGEGTLLFVADHDFNDTKGVVNDLTNEYWENIGSISVERWFEKGTDNLLNSSKIWREWKVIVFGRHSNENSLV